MTLVIKQERLKRNWNQDYVAKHLGVTPEAVHYIETGQRKPSYNNIIKLEDLFELSHRELFAETPDNP